MDQHIRSKNPDARASVTPPNADTTTATFDLRCAAWTIATTERMRSGVATDEPPNLSTFTMSLHNEKGPHPFLDEGLE